MAVAHDKTTTKHDTTKSVSITHTPVGTPTAVLVACHGRDGGSGDTEISSVDYGGTALTPIVGEDHVGNPLPPGVGDDYVQLWGAAGIPSGGQTVTITLTGTAPARGTYAVITYTGSAENVADAFGGTARANTGVDATSSSIDVTSAAGELVVDAITVRGVSENIAEGASQTERYDENMNGLGGQAAGSEEAGSATTTMSWSWTTTQDFAHVGVAIQPPQGPAADTLSVDDRDDTEVEGSWSGGDASVTSRELHRSTTQGFTPGAGTKIQDLGTGTSGSWEDNAANSSSAPAPGTLHYYKTVVSDGSTTATSNEVSVKTAPARPTRQRNAQNLLGADCLMDTDGGAGVVEGFASVTETGITASFTVDAGTDPPSQKIDVTGASQAGRAYVWKLVEGIVGGDDYFAQWEHKGSGAAGEQLYVEWLDAGDNVVGTSETIAGVHASFGLSSATVTAHADATKARVGFAVKVGSGDTHTGWFRLVQFCTSTGDPEVTATSFAGTFMPKDGGQHPVYVYWREVGSGNPWIGHLVEVDSPDYPSFEIQGRSAGVTYEWMTTCYDVSEDVESGWDQILQVTTTGATIPIFMHHYQQMRRAS